ncbi:MAG TPA: hypothetical protein VFH27_18670, partial [Longimicrobiaceae bacterium]|nr:hypothetical protein [Longimicrobiaceae bacterium]
PHAPSRPISVDVQLQELVQEQHLTASDANHAVSTAEEQLLTLDSILIEHPSQASLVAFMTDGASHALARDLAADPTPDGAVALLQRAARDTLSSLPLSQAELATQVMLAERYARRLHALLAVIPTSTEPLSGSVDTLLSQIKGHYAAHAEALHRSDSLSLAAQVLARGSRRPDPIFDSVRAMPQARAARINVARLVNADSGEERALREVRTDLVAIQMRTKQMVSALAQLPEWTEAAVTRDTVLAARFYGDSLLTVAVTRDDRPGVFLLNAEPTTSSGGQSPAGGGKPDGDNATLASNSTGGAGGTGPASSSARGALPAVAPPEQHRTDTVAVIRIPVVKRYRLQLGAGLMYSRMQRNLFETRVDTTSQGPGVLVRNVGVEHDRYAPMAVLSYTLFPLNGKVLDGRAYDEVHSVGEYLHQAGLTGQIGVSMAKPTEEFFLGLGTEPIPGVNVGWGMHTRFSDVSTHAGEFVPDAGGEAATEKRWLRSFGALTVTVDADVFLKTIGALWK